VHAGHQSKARRARRRAQGVIEYLALLAALVVAAMAFLGPFGQSMGDVIGRSGESIEETSRVMEGTLLAALSGREQGVPPALGELPEPLPAEAEDDPIILSGGPWLPPNTGLPGGSGLGPAGEAGGDAFGSGPARAGAPSTAPPGAGFGGSGIAISPAPDAAPFPSFTFPPLPPAPEGFTFISRGTSIWTGWTDVDALNITGTQGVALLTSAFNLVASLSPFNAITADLIAKGISIAFGTAQDFSGPTANAIAYFRVQGTAAFPNTPVPAPFLLFNPAFLHDSVEAIAATLVHEGTHFQQYLDGQIFNPTQTVIDIEFRAWWNAAVFWHEVRAQASPLDTRLEQEAEFGYRTALQGEAALRALIASLYT